MPLRSLGGRELHGRVALLRILHGERGSAQVAAVVREPADGRRVENLGGEHHREIGGGAAALHLKRVRVREYTHRHRCYIIHHMHADSCL